MREREDRGQGCDGSQQRRQDPVPAAEAAGCAASEVLNAEPCAQRQSHRRKGKQLRADISDYRPFANGLRRALGAYARPPQPSSQNRRKGVADQGLVGVATEDQENEADAEDGRREQSYATRKPLSALEGAISLKDAVPEPQTK